MQGKGQDTTMKNNKKISSLVQQIDNIIMGQMAEDDLDSTTVLLIFLMLCIIIIYCICLLIVGIRKLADLPTAAKKYYLIIILYIISKLLICIAVLLEIIIRLLGKQAINADRMEVYTKNIILSAEICIVELFIVAFEEYLIMCLRIIKNNSRLWKNWKRFFITLQALYLISTGVILILFNINIVEFQTINKVNLCINSLSLMSFIVALIYVNFLLTGILLPVSTNDKLRTIYKLILVLLLSRFLAIAIQSLVVIEIQGNSFRGFIQIIMENRGQYFIESAIFIGYLLYILLIEGLPVMYSLRAASINAFRRLILNAQDDMSDPLLGDKIASFISDEVQITFQNFESLDPLPIYSEVWQCLKGKYRGNVYFVRKCKLQISPYIIEEVEKELEFLKAKKIAELIPVKYFIHEEIFFLYEPYFQINLDMALEEKNDEERLKIMITLAKSISKIHNQDLSHGCINPFNVFVEKDNVYIGGYGLQSLKRYFSLASSYSNKSIFTAAEQFSSKSPIVIKPKKKEDIYSFGMILYEAMAKNKDYRQQSLCELNKKLLEEKIRPKMPQKIKDSMKKLIKECWSCIPEERPTIEEVIAILQLN